MGRLHSPTVFCKQTDVKRDPFETSIKIQIQIKIYYKYNKSKD